MFPDPLIVCVPSLQLSQALEHAFIVAYPKDPEQNSPMIEYGNKCIDKVSLHRLCDQVQHRSALMAALWPAKMRILA
jgi:hypothetical protein